jgi:hypothetical protein
MHERSEAFCDMPQSRPVRAAALDRLHRALLEDLLEEFHIEGLSEEE